MRTLAIRCFFAISCSGVLISCAHSNRSVELPVQPVSAGGRGALVRVNVPADWRPLAPSPYRAEFLAPDNQSRAYIRAMPAEADGKSCPTLVRQYATEFIGAWGGPPRNRVASKTVSNERVDFELRRKDPRPDGEIIWGRVLCREGALAVTSCTVATTREGELKGRCHDIVESLEVLVPPEPRASM